MQNCISWFVESAHTAARFAGELEGKSRFRGKRFRQVLVGSGCAWLALLPVMANGQSFSGQTVLYQSGSNTRTGPETITATNSNWAVIVVRNAGTSLDAANLTLNVSGASSYGLYIYNPASVKLTDVTINITRGGIGLRIGRYYIPDGFGANLTGDNVTINSAGTGVSVAGSSLTLRNSKIVAGSSGLDVSQSHIQQGVLGPPASASLTDVDVEGSSQRAVFIGGEAQVDWNRGNITAKGLQTRGIHSNGSYGFARASFNDVAIRTGGDEGYGVLAQADDHGTRIDLTSSSVTTQGGLSHGLFAYGLIGGSILNATDTTVETFGARAYGVYSTRGDIVPPGATNGTVVNGTGLTVLTHGDGALGLFVNRYSSIVMDGGAVATEGAGSHASVVSTGGHLELIGVRIDALGARSNGIQSLNANVAAGGVTYTASVEITGGYVVSAQGYGIAANGGTVDVIASATRISGGAGLLQASDANPDTVLNLTARDGATLVGGAVTATGAVSNVQLLAGSTWNVTGDSNVTTLVNDASSVVFSAPAGAFKTLIVHDYAGNDGRLLIHAMLGADASPADRLVIDGGTASGTTRLIVVNAGGGGAQTTADGILVVQATNGATTASGAFVLGNRVSAGAYDYLLYHGGNAAVGGDPDDQNWYLRSTLRPHLSSKRESVPNIRLEVPIFASIGPLASEYGLSLLDTMHQRVGEVFALPPARVYEERTVRCEDHKAGHRCVARVPAAVQSSVRGLPGGWARLIGERGLRDNKNFSSHGPDYVYTFGGIQAGLDLFGGETAAGDSDRAGIYAAYGQISADIKGVFGGKAGTVNMDAYTLGGYWTHKAAQGWYTDVVVQGTWYSVDAKSVMGVKVEPDGFGLAASLEGGYVFQLGSGGVLEPQAQLVYQNVSFDNVADAYGRFRLDDGETLRGRLGLRLSKTWNASGDMAVPQFITGWLRANVWHEFMGDHKTTVTATAGWSGLHAAPYLVNASLGGTWGEIGAGVTAQVLENMSLFASGAYNRSLDNRGREAWNGRIGVGLRW